MLHNYSLFGTSDDAHCDRWVIGEEITSSSDILLLLLCCCWKTFFFPSSSKFHFNQDLSLFRFCILELNNSWNCILCIDPSKSIIFIYFQTLPMLLKVYISNSIITRYDTGITWCGLITYIWIQIHINKTKRAFCKNLMYHQCCRSSVRATRPDIIFLILMWDMLCICCMSIAGVFLHSIPVFNKL